MKAIKGFITALLVSAPLFANAYWEQTLDFNPDPMVSGLNSYSFTHDLTQVGFNPASDAIDSYDLTISVYDDGRGFFETFKETVTLTDSLFDSVSKTFSGNWSGTVSTGESWTGLFTLNLLGELYVTVSSGLFEDFYLDSSTLVAQGSSASVPEPSSLALLAAGLFGIAAMRRSAARNS